MTESRAHAKENDRFGRVQNDRYRMTESRVQNDRYRMTESRVQNDRYRMTESRARYMRARHCFGERRMLES
jgi:hypothetical protein